jgi:hypothetical protein
MLGVLMELTQADIIRGAWLKCDLEWKFDLLQRRISETVKSRPDAKKICILSSRQIGKSYWSVGHAVEYLCNNKDKIARIVAPTLGNCHDIVNDNLMRITSDAPDGLIARRSAKMRWEISNESSLRLGALERANVDDMNRGGNASLIIYEECGFVKGDDFLYGVNSVLGPQLLRSNGKEIFVSSPPEDPDHPLITQIKPECEELGTFFSFTVFDSPSITPDQIVEAAIRSGCALTRDFIVAVREGHVNSANVHEIAYKTKSQLSDAFRREFLAEIIRPSTLMVVPDFRDDIRHVMPFDNPIATNWTITIDWGGVRDMTVALLHTYDYMANMDLVRDERVFPPNTSTAVIVQQLREAWENSYHVESRWADVHGQTQVDLIALGYDVNIPQKSDWLGSVQSMAVKFTTNRIYIDPRCIFVRKSLKGGMFNKTKTDFERTEKLGHCDALAALMYAIRSQNRESPYESGRYISKDMYVPYKQDIDIDLATALNPKKFGNTSKSFGGFKR